LRGRTSGRMRPLVTITHAISGLGPGLLSKGTSTTSITDNIDGALVLSKRAWRRKGGAAAYGQVVLRVEKKLAGRLPRQS